MNADEPVLAVDVDPDSDGRQHGFLSLPSPTNALDRSRWPLASLRRGDGPRVLIVGSGGGSGAAVALRRLARELDTGALRGTVVIVPDAPDEVIAALAGGRLGAPDTLVELAAVPAGFGFSPMAGLVKSGEGAALERAETAMIAFGAPESVRFAPGLAPGVPAGTVPGAVAHVRVALDGAAPPAEALAIALVGCRNLLGAGGLLDVPLELRATRTLAVAREAAFVRAPHAGLLELRVRPGQNVYRGDPLALVVDPTRTGSDPVRVSVPYDGVVLGARTALQVSPGDCVAIVAEETAR